MAYSFTLFFSKLVCYTFIYWLPNYLANVSTEPVSAEHAALLSTIFDIGGIFGGILAGLMSDNTGVRETQFIFKAWFKLPLNMVLWYIP